MKKNRIYTYLLISAFYLVGFIKMIAQPANDECRFARFIPNVNNYCSQDGEFTNVGATPDPAFANATSSCISLRWQNGVWFSFVPRKPAALIRVFGFGQGGTMRSPKILVFERCNQFLKCSPGKDLGVDELVVDNLNIGQTYFIMVESATDGAGTFRLCIEDFIPVASPESDCRDAVVLCDKSPFVVNSLTGVGSVRNEIEPGNCIGEEFASSWYKWTCEQPGSLTFTLTPNNYSNRNQTSDDLDFALYELPNGLDDCNNKRLLRCMASGANGDGFGNNLPLSQWINCNGPTGLREGETDTREDPGCATRDNNFLSPLQMEAGKSYVLIVNNFSRSGLGFSIEFGGTGTFLGPKPDFEIDAQQKFECDKTIDFINKSSSATDPIISYQWNFGDRSIPSRQTGPGPFEVVYESFGNKISALTVRSSRGCTVTKIVEFFVEPCCKDTTTLSVDAIIQDLICFNEPEGSIFSVGSAGSPEYLFSIDGINFQPNPLFDRLAAGNYNLFITDIKGCTDTTQLVINQPPPIVVDAGPDQVLEFGGSTVLNGTFVSSNGVSSIRWIDQNGNVVGDSVSISVLPVNNTTYTLIIEDENGCLKEDQVEIRVDKIYKFFTPNIIAPNGSIKNRFFNGFGNQTIKYVELIEIFDRWGNKVYEGYDSRLPDPPGETFVFNTYDSGWNGLFKGKPVEAGVYAWRAVVRYIDDEVKQNHGTLTVLR